MRNALPHSKAVLDALRFSGARPDALRAMTDSEWQEFLPLCDMMHLTIPLRRVCGDHLPGWVRLRIDANIRDNSERFERIKATYLELAEALRGQTVEYVVLKGFAQSPDFVEDPRLRMQSDIDLFCPPESILRAHDALAKIGYESDRGIHCAAYTSATSTSDHLPTMRRNRGWHWRGNAFDPDMPVSLELHFRFWNEATTRLHPRGLDQFWERRTERRVDGISFPGLSRVDGLGYTSLHVFHHLQTGQLIPHHVYELANFLHTRADDEPFWKEWFAKHDESLRRIQAVCFRLAAVWCGCRLSQEVEQEIDRLPSAVLQWFHKYSDSSLSSFPHQNQDALWMHLSMVESARDKLLVFCENLMPVRVPRGEAIQRWSPRIYASFLRHAVSRLAYHLRVLPRVLWEGFRWWWSTNDMGKQL